MAGTFRGIGRRLMGALSITGQFKTKAAEAISSKLVEVEEGLREAALAPQPVEATPQPTYNPNRAERSAARRRNRFRTSRNKAFHTKRGNLGNTDGLSHGQARLVHENVSNKGIHFIYNTKLQQLLYSSGAMEVGVNRDYIAEANEHAHV